MNLGLAGKYALVTGGSHGIGLSTALALADEGCNVAVCARNRDRVDGAVEAIRAKGVQAIGVSADVMVSEDIDTVMDTVIGAWGTLHILINNVGGGGRWGSPNIEETPEEVWLEVYNKNALAAVRFTLKALPYMRKQKWGRVVTVTSVLGREGGGRPWFNMAKTAQTTLMKNLALRPELIREGITFNSVAPGCIMIPDTGWDAERKKDPGAFDRMVRESYPLGRLGTPEEVSSVIVFVCSEQASLLNGASLPVDGAESRCF
ncbi:MAG: SDR family oxidoreductase [Alphaproteobacteria bacterium]|uniref:SDR family oxidoreductase n=1 Tax=Candidatus Nitrobium versatile TaxID=2884831 RepID=A0A953M1P2_9BACT|nr:SDR family oxidoreductase [Candidatus Nitrobium versatile]